MYSKSAVVLLAAALIAGCVDEPTSPSAPRELPKETRNIQRPPLPTLYASMPQIDVCGAATDMTLVTGDYTPGVATISNDAVNLYVTVSVKNKPEEEGWYISDTGVAVGDQPDDIPQEDGQLDGWSFPYNKVLDPPEKSFTFSIELATINASAGQTIYVSAMVGVVHPKTSDWDGEWEWILGYGVGSSTYTQVQGIQNYTVQSCSGTTEPPPPEPPPPPASGGMVTISFDDGWKETYTRVFPIMQEFGLKGNVSINSEPIDGGYPAYMTVGEVKELSDAGWAIVSHSVSHPDLTQLSAAELDRELRASKEWIASHGFKTADIFIVPFHSWGTRERNAIEQYYGAARGYTSDQFSPERLVSYPITDRYGITAFEPEWAPFTTAEGRQQTVAYAERAIRNGEFIDIFFHHVTAAQEASFRELIRMLSAYKANIRTYAEIL